MVDQLSQELSEGVAIAQQPKPSRGVGKRNLNDGTAQRLAHRWNWGPGYIVKLLLMAAINAVAVLGLIITFTSQAWGIFAGLLLLLIAADYVYFARRASILPMKYIYPGLAFLLVFQIFVVMYTVYVSFTNWGTGHNGTKEAAVNAILMQFERQVGDIAYPVAVVQQGDDFGLAIVAQDGSLCEGAVPGDICIGDAETPLHVIADATADGQTVTSVPGWEILGFSQILQNTAVITDLRVPMTDDPEDGSLRTTDGRNAFPFRSYLVFDEAADTMVNTQTGEVFFANSEGQFESELDGSTLQTGWRVNVGFRNYLTAFGDSRYLTPFFRILAWTIAFALLSVITTFLLGLFFAITFNDSRMRGRKIYRILMIFPYAIPGFLAALIWRGLLNRSFGFINQVLLGGAQIGWLQDPWLAKLAVLGVNLWLGFPYMFLICTGALQSLPDDVMEAAKVDGAGALRTFRSVTMPLLLVSTAPLLISSFAFNFNNFTLIYMLTGGGPRFGDAAVPLGHTDILISMVYNISGLDGTGGSRDYGLASALSIVVFLIVGTVSAIAFRQTRKLEEVM